MSMVKVDKKGRIYLPKDLREEYGEKFKLISLESSIRLVPVDENPVEGLEKSMRSSKDIDLDDISDKVEEAAREELNEGF